MPGDDPDLCNREAVLMNQTEARKPALEIIKFLRELELTSLVTRQGLNLFRSPRLKIITKTTYKKTQMDIHAII